MEQFMIQFFGFFEMLQNFFLGLTRQDLGFISTVFLGLCSFPLFWGTIKAGHCKNISGWFITAWFIGDMTGIAYILPLQEVPLLLNYGVNSIMATTMLVYKIRRG